MFRSLARLLRRGGARAVRAPAKIRRRPVRGGQGIPPPVGAPPAHAYAGRLDVAYRPVHDGHPDPGEVVWTWVPYEDDPRIGKDRPVVILGRAIDGSRGELAVVQLSSRPHQGDPRWLGIGSGAWDRQGRASSVRLDRMLAVSPSAVRREGAALPREHFDAVVRGVLAGREHGRR